MRLPLLWRNVPVAIGASIGVAVLRRPHFQGLSQLFAEADSALYVAKAAGRNTIRVFAESLGERPALSLVDRVAG